MQSQAVDALQPQDLAFWLSRALPIGRRWRMAKPGQFTIELEQEDDGRWIGEVPTLPGVMAYGQTRARALAAVQALARFVRWRIALNMEKSLTSS